MEDKVFKVLIAVSALPLFFIGLQVGRGFARPFEGMSESSFRKYQRIAAERDAIDSLRRMEKRDQQYKAANDDVAEDITKEDRESLTRIILGE